MDVKVGVALVTGAARGIGKAIAEEFLKKGYKVCCCDVNTETGNKTVEELQEIYGKANCFFDKCDVSSSEEFEATYLKTKESFGYVDILVNNAGVEQGRVMEINLNGVINGCNIAYKYMGKHNGGNGGGVVVNVSSIAALEPSPFLITYSASKAAVLSLTRSFGHELHYEKTGIKFVALCPAAIDTDMLKTCEGEYFPEDFNLYKKELVSLPPSAVGEAVFQLLRDGKNGVAMTVIAGKENSYVPFPDIEMF